MNAQPTPQKGQAAPQPPAALLNLIFELKQEMGSARIAYERLALEVQLLREALEAQQAPPERWLTVAEAAQALNLSPDTVYAMLTDGRLVAERTGQGRGTWRIPHSKLAYTWAEAAATARRLGLADRELRQLAQGEKKMKGTAYLLLPRTLFA